MFYWVEEKGGSGATPPGAASGTATAGASRPWPSLVRERGGRRPRPSVGRSQRIDASPSWSRCCRANYDGASTVGLACARSRTAAARCPSAAAPHRKPSAAGRGSPSGCPARRGPDLCGNQNFTERSVESSPRPPRHRRDACSMAWRGRFLTARPSQDGRAIAEK